jgi:alanine-glyoxylate transaminase/serine-glyoxylate transaminase/serine-pyruvate transaminase
MGCSSRQSNVLMFLAALEQCLLDQGLEIQSGAGVAAATKAYQEWDAHCHE